jgi:hypothetical protein
MPLKIHLIPDTKSDTLVDQIIGFLNRFFHAPTDELKIEFVKADLDLIEIINEKRTWEEIWKICNDYKQENQIPIQDNYILFITTDGNELNYFASQAMDDKTIGFVHCSNWKEGFGVSDFNGTTFHLVVLLIRMIFYGTYEEAEGTYHIHPIACINDFNRTRDQVILKFKSAHICSQCVTSINEYGNLTTQTHGFFHGAMRALQEIRLDIVRKEVNLVPLEWRLEMDDKFKVYIQIKGFNSKIKLKLPKGASLSCYLSILKSQDEDILTVELQEKMFLKNFPKFHKTLSPNLNQNDALKCLNSKLKNKAWTEAFKTEISKINKEIEDSFKNYPEIIEKLSITKLESVRRINLHHDRIPADFWERFQLD